LGMCPKLNSYFGKEITDSTEPLKGHGEGKYEMKVDFKLIC